MIARPRTDIDRVMDAARYLEARRARGFIPPTPLVVAPMPLRPVADDAHPIRAAMLASGALVRGPGAFVARRALTVLRGR